MADTNITIPRETDFDVDFSYLNEDNTARALTGATVYFTIKSDAYDTDADDSEALISKDVTSHTDAANGLTTISLTDVETSIAPATYFYDIVVVESDTKRYRAAQGRCTITSGPTNR